MEKKRLPPGTEVVVDTTVLSHFARSGHLDLLRRLFPNGLWTTSDVIGELTEGARKYPELKEVLDATSSWLRVIDDLTESEHELSEELRRNYRHIRKGADAPILAVAKERKFHVFTDDNRKGKGMKFVARQEEIPLLTTQDLLREAVSMGLITPEDECRIRADMKKKARYEVKDP